MIKDLVDRHEEWLKIAYSICKDKELSKDLVQDMYVRIDKYVNEPEKIMVGDRVNPMYIYITIRNTFYLYEKHKKRICLHLDGNMSNVKDTLSDDPETRMENEAMEIAHDSVINSILEEVSTWHWYDEKLFRLYFCTDQSLRDIANDTKISLTSIYNSCKNYKRIIKEKFGEDVMDLFNEDYDKIK
jgi:RNA polymerase sigma factor (sigma-70 family)